MGPSQASPRPPGGPDMLLGHYNGPALRLVIRRRPRDPGGRRGRLLGLKGKEERSGVDIR